MPVLSTAIPGQEATVTPSWLRWSKTSTSAASQAERQLLELCQSDLRLQDTVIGDSRKHEIIHSISGGAENTTPLVCLQGYGAGAAIYYRNMDFMCRHFQMHCVDWLGTGLSGRPPFKAKTTQQTEDFFIEGLKAWYEQQGLDKMILMGHSLGGYLAALYAQRHPEDVKHLIMVSPAAVSGKPVDYELPTMLQSRWTWQGQLYRGFKFLFASGVTPQMLIRTLGPWGHDFVGLYVKRRFQEGVGIANIESDRLQSYFFHISAAKPSGEHALRHIFHPIAWGKEPLENRLSNLKVPVSFIYGQTDWMDPKGASKICRSIESNGQTRLAKSDRTISIIPDAGHFVFLDQPELFNEELMKICHEYV
eukprot:g1611.t1